MFATEIDESLLSMSTPEHLPSTVDPAMNPHEPKATYANILEDLAAIETEAETIKNVLREGPAFGNERAEHYEALQRLQLRADAYSNLPPNAAHVIARRKDVNGSIGNIIETFGLDGLPNVIITGPQPGQRPDGNLFPKPVHRDQCAPQEVTHSAPCDVESEHVNSTAVQQSEPTVLPECNDVIRDGVLVGNVARLHQIARKDDSIAVEYIDPITNESRQLTGTVTDIRKQKKHAKRATPSVVHALLSDETGTKRSTQVPWSEARITRIVLSGTRAKPVSQVTQPPCQTDMKRNETGSESQMSLNACVAALDLATESQASLSEAVNNIDLAELAPESQLSLSSALAKTTLEPVKPTQQNSTLTRSISKKPASAKQPTPSTATASKTSKPATAPKATTSQTGTGPKQFLTPVRPDVTLSNEAALQLLRDHVATHRKITAKETATFATQCAGAFASYDGYDSEPDKLVNALMSLVKRTLPTKVSIVDSHIARLRENHRTAVSCEAPTISTSRAFQQAQLLVRDGHYSRAVKLLLREESSPLGAAGLEVLRKLHPDEEDLEEATRTLNGVKIAKIEADDLIKIIRNGCDGRAPGPSGWTEELLLAACTNEQFKNALTIFIRDIINNDVTEHTRTMLTSCRLFGIQKPTKQNQGGETKAAEIKVRPIAVGEVFLKIACQYIYAIVLPQLNECVGPHQYGNRINGTETVIHATRKFIRENNKAVLLTLDCRNAFNSMLRRAMAEGLEAFSNKLFQMINLFRLAYAQPSDLLVRFEGDTIIIDSKRGSRQGDVFGGALFNIGLATVTKDFHEHFPDVKLWMYMDDITLGGDPDDVARAAIFLQQRLLSVGLEVNLSKSHWYGERETFAKCPAGLERSDEGVVVLGAWITRKPETTAKFLDGKLAELRRFFNTISYCDDAENKGLPPEIALPVLQHCGPARWNFITRTHPPEEMSRHTQMFDAMVLDCFCKISNISDDTDRPLSQQQRALIHLPMRDGGLGITLYTGIATSNYLASVDPQSTSQRDRTLEFNKIMIDKIIVPHPDWNKHRQECAAKGASSWMRPQTHTIQPGTSKLTGDLYRECLKMRLRYDDMPKRTAVSCNYCSMKQTMAPHEFLEHVLGCVHRPTNNVSTRHTAVKKILQQFCLVNAMQVENEPYFKKDKIARNTSHSNHPDLKITMPQSGKVFYVDVTSKNHTSVTHMNKTHAASDKKQESEKRAKYDENAKEENAEFVAFQFGVLSGLNEDAWRFVKMLAREGRSGISADELRHELSCAIAAQNARIRRCAHAIAK